MREELELMAAELRALHARKNKLYQTLERITVEIAKREKMFYHAQRQRMYDRRAEEILAGLTPSDIKALKAKIAKR